MVGELILPAWPTRQDASAVERDPLDSFKKLSAVENMRTPYLSRDKNKFLVPKLGDLPKFSNNFKLTTRVPEDLYSILSIIEKQEEDFRARTGESLDQERPVASQIVQKERQEEVKLQKMIAKMGAEEHKEEERKMEEKRTNEKRKAQDPEEARSSSDIFSSKVAPTPTLWNLPLEATAASRLFDSQGISSFRERITTGGAMGSNAWEMNKTADKEEGSFRKMQGKVEPHTHYVGEQDKYPINPPEVASSIGISQDGYQSSMAGRTHSTRPTTVSDWRNSKPSFDKVLMPQNSITEESEITIDGTVPSLGDVGDVGDGQSTISDDSVLLHSVYRDVIIKGFAAVLLQELPSKHLLPNTRILENSAFRQSFNAFIKSYAKEVMEGTVRYSRRRQASKAIRRLRGNILLRLQEIVGDFQNLEMSGKISTTVTRHVKSAGLEEQTWREKCSEWEVDRNDDGIDAGENHLLRLENLELPFFDLDLDHRYLSDGVQNGVSISSTEQDEDEDITLQHLQDLSNISNPDDQDVHSYLTQHDAFPALTHNIQKAIEKHFGNTMELIRHRVMVALRRPEMTEKATGGVFRVSFRTEWDSVEFLEDQYPAGRMRSLRYALVLTGEAVNAQLTTVEKYLGQFWPKHMYRLVDTISSTIGQSERDGLSSDICFLPGKRTLTVLGSEELIVTIAQQFAWLGAACRASTGQLAFCYTTFSEVNDPQIECPGLTFDIAYDVSSLGLEAIESCWHDLVGNSVIATGFPTSERDYGEIGLQIPLEIMAALAKVPLATRFCGGYVLKGRSIMLVPVEKKGTSIQWHLVQKQGKRRIHYRDLSVMCPNRLLFDAFEEEDLSSTNCFLGWCPQTKNHLATTDYDYRSVGYSSTPRFSKRTISLTNISFGFQQWGTAGLQFELGKKDGYYHNQTSDFYEDMLDDAAQISIILQDMEDRRAWLANAETMILHITLHRNTIRPFKGKGLPMDLHTGIQDNPLSVRQAMLSNRDVVIRRDRQMNEDNVTKKLFQHLVSELFTIFEGLEGVQEEITKESGKELKLGEPNRLHGWEYLDIVNRKRHPQIRSTELRKTCGGWPKLMRELNAITLFGVRFHDALQPEVDHVLCSEFKRLPKGKDYLAMDVSKLQSLYEENGSHERGNLAKITLSGTQLQQSTHLFGPCPKTSKYSKNREKGCTCERVQQLMFKKNDTNITVLQGLADSGAIIIGQGNASWKDRFRGPKRNKVQAQSSRRQRSIPPTEPATSTSAPISQATNIRQDTLELTVSVTTQDSTSSTLSTQTGSSSRSGYMTGGSSIMTENTIERVNGKQTLRRKPNFPSSCGRGGTIVES